MPEAPPPEDDASLLSTLGKGTNAVNFRPQQTGGLAFPCENPAILDCSGMIGTAQSNMMPQLSQMSQLPQMPPLRPLSDDLEQRMNIQYPQLRPITLSQPRNQEAARTFIAMQQKQQQLLKDDKQQDKVNSICDLI